MVSTRKNVSRKHRGSGYLMDQQFFDPTFKNPVGSNHHSSFSTATEIRPVLLSTYAPAKGGRRGSRKASRKASRKVSRKNRKASRKNRKASRKNRKASRKSVK